jgi:hypothetical protein
MNLINRKRLEKPMCLCLFDHLPCEFHWLPQAHVNLPPMLPTHASCPLPPLRRHERRSSQSSTPIR